MQIGKLTTHGPDLKMFIYGFTGAGKTHFAGTALDMDIMRPVLFVNTDHGQLTLLDRADDDGLIQVIPKDYIELRQVVISQRRDKYPAFTEAVAKSGLVLPKDGFRTLILDDLSSTHWLALMKVIGYSVSDREAKGKDRSEDIAELGDYGRARIWMHKLLNELRSLPMHVIVTAKAERVRDETTGKLITQPLLFGKVTHEAGAFFDFVGLLTAVEAKQEEDLVIRRRLYWALGDRADGKERLGLPGSFLENPSVAKIFNRSTRLQTLLKEQANAADQS